MPVVSITVSASVITIIALISNSDLKRHYCSDHLRAAENRATEQASTAQQPITQEANQTPFRDAVDEARRPSQSISLPVIPQHRNDDEYASQQSAQ